MYLIVIGILSIVLAFPVAPFRGLRDPGWVLTAAAVATVLPSLLAWLTTRRAVRLLEEQPHDPGIGQHSYGRGMSFVQLTLALCHGGLLCATDWIWLCTTLVQRLGGVARPRVGDPVAWPGVPGLLAIVPFLLSVLLVWLAAYPAERAVRQIALEIQLFRGRPVHPVWTLGQFIAYSFRHQILFILAPMMLILAARDFIERYEDRLRDLLRNREAPDLLLGLVAVGIAVIAPVILRYVWVTQPLPDGPLRDRLLYLCRKLKMRCRDILVWRSGGMIVNAAVMGVVPRLRYVMITDAMLEQMDDAKIEAVFGHESGHVKRHHIFYFLLFAFISGCLITVLAQYTRGVTRTTFEIAAAAAGALMLLKWGMVFGWISRNFERQADVFGVRTLALGGLPCTAPCALHQPLPDSPRSLLSRGSVGPLGPAAGAEFVAARSTVDPRDPLCASAAHVFADTLHEVAVLNGIPPEGKSWRHGSISRRARTVEALALDPRATASFEQHIKRIKLGIWAAAVISAAWAAWEIRIWTILGLPG